MTAPAPPDPWEVWRLLALHASPAFALALLAGLPLPARHRAPVAAALLSLGLLVVLVPLYGLDVMPQRTRELAMAWAMPLLVGASLGVMASAGAAWARDRLRLVLRS